jgi:hypothetical protein
VDRAWASPDQYGAAMRPGRMATINLLLPHAGGECRKSHVDAITGETIHGHAVLRRTSDDCLVTQQRLPRASHTRGAVDAYNGDRGDLSQTTLESDPAYASGVPILTPWGLDYTGESSLEYR